LNLIVPYTSMSSFLTLGSFDTPKKNSWGCRGERGCLETVEEFKPERFVFSPIRILYDDLSMLFVFLWLSSFPVSFLWPVAEPMDGSSII
jgi:hypothetical protein